MCILYTFYQLTDPQLVTVPGRIEKSPLRHIYKQKYNVVVKDLWLEDKENLSLKDKDKGLRFEDNHNHNHK